MTLMLKITMSVISGARIRRITTKIADDACSGARSTSAGMRRTGSRRLSSSRKTISGLLTAPSPPPGPLSPGGT